MLDDTPLDSTTDQGSPAAADAAPAEGAPAEGAAPPAAKKATAKKAPAKKAASKKAAPKKAAAKKPASDDAGSDKEAVDAADPESGTKPASDKKKATKKAASKKAAPKKAAGKKVAAEDGSDESATGRAPVAAPLFQAPETTAPRQTVGATDAQPAAQTRDGDTAEPAGTGARGEESDDGDDAPRRRRRRGGRRRRKAGDAETEGGGSEEVAESTPEGGGEEGETGAGTRRRRRRRRAGEEGADGSDDPQNTVTKVRQGRSAEDQISSVSGSTRLEAKKQRRREGREAGRRRAPIVSEAEFLARRESVDRVMVIRQREDLTQIGVLEDKVLVEHYVARESQTSLIGNVYLGRVQNVLPSMEAAFIDIGKGRNAVLYAGEVNWSALGHQEGTPRKIESVLSSGQSVLVQVTKDPVGHKGARLTSQISLAGRFLVYVPDGTTSGISRKLPDTERNRLKTLLKDIVPDTAGVIVRTAAEGASEAELTRDVERLKARWEDIEGKAKGKAPALLYGEPDLTLKVVRDLFTEDFSKLVIEGDDAWETVQGYVAHVAPDLEHRLERYETPESGVDVFAAYRIDEQIAKGLDRKVWLPSGGSLIIDRTEAMTVVDVNTGKFTGSGGNLEETVTKNNLEAAEEMVRQLRLRDIGGIIVIDFIDMVLESNRDLVLRRLVECLGRDRTRHQVAEVTSLGLVQMTRKRIGTGLLEAFSHNCEACNGRGVVVKDAPVEPRRVEEEPRRGGRRSRGRGRSGDQAAPAPKPVPSPKDVAAVARPHEPDAEPGELVGALPEATDPLATEALAEEALAEEPAEAPEPAVVVEEAAVVVEEATVEVAVPESVEPVRGPEPAPEPEAAPEPGPTPEPEPAPEPEAPVTVVTRGRRRSASRPAGPPVVGAAVGSALEHGAVEPGTAEVEPGAEPPVEHVPVKKRGARKR